MRKSFGIASALIALGLVIGIVGLWIIGFDFTRLDNHNYEERVFEIDADFDKISASGCPDDITILPSEDAEARVVCYDRERIAYSVSVKDGELSVEIEDSRRWYDYVYPFGMTTKNTPVSIYLPKTEYESLDVSVDTSDVEVSDKLSFGNAKIEGKTCDIIWGASLSGRLSIEVSTGNVSLSEMSAQSAQITTTTGDVTVSSVEILKQLKVACSTGRINVSDSECGELEAQTDTGDVTLKKTDVSENVSIKTDTGDVHLEKTVAVGELDIATDTGDVSFELCDAENITVKTDTGDVTGSLLTEKIFYPKSSSGDIEIPRSTKGGLCEITTSTGDIEMEIAD